MVIPGDEELARKLQAELDKSQSVCPDPNSGG